jgi:4,5-dihydroxyphthalate decarboxylase
MTQDIEVCGGDYEHTLGFGTPHEATPRLRYTITALGELSRRVLSGDAFDVAEYSLANYIMLKDRGDDRLTAIPVFPSRAFRNASVFVPVGSALHDLRDLAGCRVGVSDFAMTTAVWTRGHLSDDVGLDCKSIDWVTGGNPRFAAPGGVRATATTDDLETLLLDGKIDELMAGRPRDQQLPPDQRRLRFLAPDTEAIERRYFSTTGLFPIMHTVVLHARIAGDPQTSQRVFEHYVQTKQTALKRRLSTSLLPFSDRAWDHFSSPGGPDPYQHGLTELNRRNITTLSRYLLEQGFIRRAPDIDALFVPGSALWRDR